jgi:GDP-L-fucose synthase
MLDSGYDLSIEELVYKMRDIIYPDCQIKFNGQISINGTPKKLMDNSKITQMGWKSKINLEEGIKISYEDFLRLNS